MSKRVSIEDFTYLFAPEDDWGNEPLSRRMKVWNKELRALVRYYGGDPGRDTCLRTEGSDDD